MCWYNFNIPAPIQAENDIPVFKIGVFSETSKAKSYFQDFEYEEGKEYTTEIGSVHTAHCIFSKSVHYINKGFHSYSKDMCEIIKGPVKIWINTICSYPKIYKLVKLECRVPKGAIYYMNDEGEIVSDKIIIDSIIQEF